ncbi:hypothetical protein BJ508DRAFT_108813 [Ascobolus immersus RN42]|uniref:Uncharacterized protein n=1 Tax=Ascobolus immersus RN42 TaxID=1160509 RepID=A0A3N4I731_ASCIM|nr:hypothetical protein BJ508DRAFT_108813 [Ascobolus immersus RN42]
MSLEASKRQTTKWQPGRVIHTGIRSFEYVGLPHMRGNTVPGLPSPSAGLSSRHYIYICTSSVIKIQIWQAPIHLLQSMATSTTSYNTQLLARYLNPSSRLPTTTRPFTQLLTILYDPTHSSSRFCPPSPLFPTVESHLLFYLTDLEPHLAAYHANLNGNKRHEHLLNQCAHDFWLSVDIMAAHWTVLRDRHRARLLRQSQCELVAAALQALQAEVRSIISSDRMEDVEAFVEKVKTACKRTRVLLENFLLSPKLRSERIEVLLLQYLREDGVNLDVVMGLERAGEEKDRAVREYEESVPFSLRDI